MNFSPFSPSQYTSKMSLRSAEGYASGRHEYGKTDADEAQRIVDFVQGIMYALDGRIDQISESIYLCAPNNMSVSRENFAAYADQQAAAPAGAPQWNAQQPQGPSAPEA